MVMKMNKKLCCRKEAARCFVSVYIFDTKRRAQSFVISCFGFRYTTAYN